jgi:LuxR family quorum sensing-dependent transcriptional regulator
MGSCDMRVKALSGLDALERSQTQDDVIGAIRDALEFAGAEFFCFNFLPQPKEKFENVILATNVPAPWLQLYIEQDFAAADPSIRFCRHTVHPFEYKDAPYNAETEPRAAEVMRRAEGFHLSGGLVVPIPSPAGCKGNVWIGGYDFHVAVSDRPIAHILAIYAFERLRKLGGHRQLRKPSITDREREVLSWIAAGKSALEIGEILCITKRTVDEHTQIAARKLGAVNRAQAVALAIRARIIAP